MQCITHLEGLHHEQHLAEGSRPLAQDLVRWHRNYGGQGENEGVDVGHVQVEGGNGVGDGV